jgi:hypothetical protein
MGGLTSLMSLISQYAVDEEFAPADVTTSTSPKHKAARELNGIGEARENLSDLSKRENQGMVRPE